MLYCDRLGVSEKVPVNKTVNEKSMVFVTIGIFQIKGLSFNQMSAMIAIMY